MVTLFHIVSQGLRFLYLASILYSFGVLCWILYLAADSGREEDLWEILSGQAIH